jgi:uncharacterized protein (TIGR03492 family)
MRALFVSNGHGEAAIAERIAQELRALVRVEIDHLALVGDGLSETMTDVGPQRAMPSGGLIAMGNVANIARDVRSGLLALSFAQYKYLRGVRGRYDVAAAIGDAYALMMTLIARAPTVFVGTAKSVNVAPYGPFEERVLRRARACFVRDEPTARRLREHGVPVEEPANVIVDLFATSDDPRAQDAVAEFDPAIALFPGSRESAYADARFLLNVAGDLARGTRLGAVLSVARGLSADRFAQAAREDGFDVVRFDDATIPFALARAGRTVARAWRGTLGPILDRVSLVLGQAGTANEAAAAAGVPVVAFERERDRKGRWYRQRQRGLLGDAMIVLPAGAREAAAGVAGLIGDAARREAMGAQGRARMGSPGGARRVAERLYAVAGAS